jgi:alkylated DNA repair dioxygenase AlkB
MEYSYHPDFLDNIIDIHRFLMKSIGGFDTSLKSRSTKSYGKPYSYSGMASESSPFKLEIEDLALRIESLLGWKPNNCLINYYPDGNSTMGFHSDDMSQCDTVAIYSFGSPRQLAIVPKGNKRDLTCISMEPNSLLVIGKEFNDNYLHSIPREPHIKAPRYSLSFRLIKPL